MKKILKKYKDAIIYYQNNPNQSISSIAKQFDCERHTLTKYAKFSLDWDNIDLTTDTEYIFLEDNEKEALRLYKESDLTILEIVQKTGLSKNTISRLVEKCNYSKRGPHRIYNISETIFDDIKTEEQAYWLGFITADGYVNEERNFLNIKLQVSDYNHLVKFAKFINAPESLIKDDRGGSGQIIKSITVNSKHLVDSLVKLGIRQGKSGKEKPITTLSRELTIHYIRGLIDGDGNLTDGERRKIGLVGSLDIINFVKNFINDNIHQINSKYKYIYPKGTIYDFSIYSTDVVISVYKTLYENASIYLNRKYAIAMKTVAVLKSEKNTGTPEQGQSEVKA